MTKKLLILVALVGISFQTTSCTSNKSQDDSTVVENADVEKIEAEDNFAANPDATLPESDPSLQAALGETAPADLQNSDSGKVDSIVPNTPDIPPADVAAAPTLDENSLNDPLASASPTDIVAGTDPQPTNLTESTAELPPPTAMTELTPQAEPAPMADTPPVIENSGSNVAMNDMPSAPVEKPIKSAGGGLKKISTTVPYKTAGGWVNTVYVARPGETLKDISQKIFASDKSKDLKKIAENSYLKSRPVKPGDKVYYVSPNRPDDAAKTLLYYEDMGMMPETYVAKTGDTLKKVAKQILGFEKGYVEMWTANSIESKTKLNEGDVIRYWKSDSGVASQTAMQNANQKLPQLMDAPQNSQANMPPQPQQNMAANNPPPQPEMPMPPAPAMGATNQGVAPPVQPEMQMPPPPDATASLPPPPPPPPAEIAPPPPVEDVAAAAPQMKKKKNVAEEEASTGIGGLDENQMIIVGAVGVLLAMLAFVLIKRKKKKAAEQAAVMASELNIG